MQGLPFAAMWRKLHPESAEETRRFWDLRADEFNAMTRGKDRQSAQDVLDWLAERQAFGKNSDVLDLGCGAGRHALEFARRARRVTGLDISPNMIAHARKNAQALNLHNLSFRVAPWEEVDIDACGFRGAFDLAFASMSPALCSEETLLKFNASSRGACFMSGFIERSDLLLRRLAGRLFPGLCWPVHKGGIYFAFSLLWQHGIYADVHCVDASWSKHWSVQSAFEAYAPLLRDYAPDRPGLEEALLGCLREEASDGLLLREVCAQSAWLYWKKDGVAATAL